MTKIAKDVPVVFDTLSGKKLPLHLRKTDITDQ